MTVTCIVCKKFAITGILIRSFHKFPSDGVLRHKWISALGLSKVPKTATVCSDHFDEKSFHQTDGYTRVRRLLANAVPSTWKKAIPCTEEKALGTIQVDENITRACGGIGCHNLAVHSLGLVTSPTNNCPIVFVCTCERNENFNIVHTKSSMLLSMHTAGTCQRSMRINENSSMYNAGSEDNSHRKSLSAETNLEVPYKKTKEEQGSGKGCSKIGFMDGYVKKYISREDFVSDEAWQRFLRFKICKELKNKAIRQQKIRAQKKISNLQAMVTTFKKKRCRLPRSP